MNTISPIVFATNNRNKVEEIRNILGTTFDIITLQEAGIDIEIPEPHDTLEENARAKSATIYNMTGMNCFGEDTGLEVEALGGAPGVKSARYAGEEKDFNKNIDKLLHELKGTHNRRARFRTVISLQWEGTEFQFEGISNGIIIEARKGSYGFGYDSVFQPDGVNKTFGEMELSEKNKYSHRKRAMEGLICFLIEKRTGF